MSQDLAVEYQDHATVVFLSGVEAAPLLVKLANLCLSARPLLDLVLRYPLADWELSMSPRGSSLRVTIRQIYPLI